MHGKEPRGWPVEELQATYCVFEANDAIMSMSQKVISLRYLMLFGGVVPQEVPFALLVFVVELRSVGHLLATVAQRLFPRVTSDIDTWQTVLGTVILAGLSFSALRCMDREAESWHNYQGTPH